MPGKYSYGVVLGDLSTRGVISLPQDQHDRYTQQSPSTRRAVHELRLRGTQSAAGDYRRIVGTNSRFNEPSGHRFETVLQPVRPQGNGRLNISADDQSKRAEAWRSKYTEIIPWSEPPEETTVTQQTPSNSSGQNRSEPANRTQRPGMSQRPATGVKQASKIVSSFRATRSDNNLRRPVQNGVENVPPVPEISAHQMVTQQPKSPERVHAIPRANVQPPAYSPPRNDLPKPPNGELSRTSSRNTILRVLSGRSKERPQSRTMDRTNSQLSIPSPDLRKALPVSPREQQPIPNPDLRKTLSMSPNVQQLKDEQRVFAMTKVRDPISVMEEPDFQGFSDDFGPPSSYFDILKDGSSHSKTSSVESTIIIQRPESSEHDDTTTLETPKASSYSAAGQNTIARQAVSRASQRRSESSASDVSVQNLSKPIVSLRQGITYEPQGWRLPEISENHAFSPSIFEDNEGEAMSTPFDHAELETSMGKISSGRDVNFENDAASELSAALPPPISRFKDDEDEFSANMTKLFGQDAASAMVKHSSIGRPSGKKSKGFFSRFKSKNQQAVN